MTRAIFERFGRCLVSVVMMVTAWWASTGAVSAKVWHVCMQCTERDTASIGEALMKAEPRDTILVYWEPGFPYYMEELVIDKPVRIISNVAAGDIPNYDLYPVITSLSKQIVHITVPGVELIGFNLMYLAKPGECEEEAACYEGRVGIRLDAPATIRQCAITNCTTGILAAYRIKELQSGSSIERCRIGIPPDHGITPAGLEQTSNHFGLVLLGCRQDGPGLGSGRDVIRDCQIMRNTLYGVVYTRQNAPELTGNIIEINGKAPFRVIGTGLAPGGSLVWVDQ